MMAAQTHDVAQARQRLGSLTSENPKTKILVFRDSR